MVKYLRLIITFFILCIPVNTWALTDAEVNRQASDLGEQIMSPYCPGRTLSACPSDQARQLRDKVKEMVRQGYSQKAVINQLEMIYGKDIYGAPKKEGFGMFAWVVPGAFVLIGFLLVILTLKKSVGTEIEYNERDITE